MQQTSSQTSNIACSSLAWQTVQLARHPERPLFVDYRDILFDEFVEFSGDRCLGEDPAIQTAWASFMGQTVMVIAHSKGRTQAEKKRNHYGMAYPQAYRKATRAVKLAEKFGKPVLSFIDTPGGYPGKEAEERGQAEAIASCLMQFAGVQVPVIATVLGEGGSGGAIAIGLANTVLMLSNAVYTVISPEACASILWRDAQKKAEAAEQLGLTAPVLLRLGVVDRVLAEPAGGAQADPHQMARDLKAALHQEWMRLSGYSADQLVEQRRERFYRIGYWEGKLPC